MLNTNRKGYEGLETEASNLRSLSFYRTRRHVFDASSCNIWWSQRGPPEATYDCVRIPTTTLSAIDLATLFLRSETWEIVHFSKRCRSSSIFRIRGERSGNLRGFNKAWRTSTDEASNSIFLWRKSPIAWTAHSKDFKFDSILEESNLKSSKSIKTFSKSPW